MGSDTLKADKSLYGEINEEVQLLDGNLNIYVACKTDKNGALNYVIYTKDEEGKIVKDPVVDGVKLTPATYLKNLQTKLTWRIDELTAENPTIQKKLLLELYKTELADLGVVFDKKSSEYSSSILGQIEIAENERAQKEFRRKQVGGFANQLEPLGIDHENESTWPKLVNLSEIESKINKLKFQKENVKETRENELKAIKNEADSIVLKLKEENSQLKQENAEILKRFEEKKAKHSQNIHTLNGIKTDIQTLLDEGCISADFAKLTVDSLETGFRNIALTGEEEKQLLEFDLDGRCVTKIEDWKGSVYVKELLFALSKEKNKYIELRNKPLDDSSNTDAEIERLKSELLLAEENNKRCDMLSSFLDWKQANEKVVKLKNDYAQLLRGINTGVEGLEICVDENEIYLTYNGSYDPKYFNNLNGEQRKLSSYSGTQKPVVCLLLQAYLLSKKPKALRYLWIDNVPIDNKTKLLLQEMGERLGVTIIVNITGDFSKQNLDNGEILIEGGEVFFR